MLSARPENREIELDGIEGTSADARIAVVHGLETEAKAKKVSTVIGGRHERSVAASAPVGRRGQN